MGKKHKAKLKEIERLRALYGQVQEQSDQTVGAPDVEAVATPTVAESVTTPEDHGYIRKDLVGLIILIIIMLVVLVGLNWLVANTSFAGWLVGLFGI